MGVSRETMKEPRRERKRQTKCQRETEREKQGEEGREGMIGLGPGKQGGGIREGHRHR